MQTHKKISEVFPEYLFWDMDCSQLDWEKDKHIIIPRALFATDEISFNEDIRKIEIYYPSDIIIDVLRNTTENISNEVCKMVAERYQVPLFNRYSSVA